MKHLIAGIIFIMTANPAFAARCDVEMFRGDLILRIDNHWSDSRGMCQGRIEWERADGHRGDYWFDHCQFHSFQVTDCDVLPAQDNPYVDYEVLDCQCR